MSIKKGQGRTTNPDERYSEKELPRCHQKQHTITGGGVPPS